jgi:hypothetical protein
MLSTYAVKSKTRQPISKTVILFAISGIFLSNCAPIEQKTIVSTPVSQSLIAGVGDSVLKAEGRENMPNAFGRADLFGRTRPTGFTNIQYGGMQGNKIVLLRDGVVTQSDATTMNSTGVLIPTQQQTYVSGYAGSRPFSGTATTSETVYVPPSGSTSVSSQQSSIPIVVDWKSNPRIPMLGRTIVIENATPTALNYHIE